MDFGLGLDLGQVWILARKFWGANCSGVSACIEVQISLWGCALNFILLGEAYAAIIQSH